MKSSFYSEDMAARYPEISWDITPGNSSPLTDGASAMLIMSEEMAAELGLTPRARFHSFADPGPTREIMLTGPIPATHKALKRSGLGIDDIDAYEVNEAFAPVPLAWAAELQRRSRKLNPRGGAIASVTRSAGPAPGCMTTLLNYLERPADATDCRRCARAAGWPTHHHRTPRLRTR